MWDIWLPVSEAPTASMTMTEGSWARKRALRVELRGAPPDTMSNIDPVSWGSPRSAAISSSSTRGLAKASPTRSAEHTSELQSLMRISYAVFYLKNTTHTTQQATIIPQQTHK